MRNWLHPGGTIEAIAPHDLESGDGAQVAGLFLVAQNDAISGQSFIGITSGVVELPKLVGEAWAQGAAIYWDEATRQVTIQSADRLPIGLAAAPASAADALNTVLLGGGASAGLNVASSASSSAGGGTGCEWGSATYIGEATRWAPIVGNERALGCIFANRRLFAGAYQVGKLDRQDDTVNWSFLAQMRIKDAGDVIAVNVIREDFATNTRAVVGSFVTDGSNTAKVFGVTGDVGDNSDLPACFSFSLLSGPSTTGINITAVFNHAFSLIRGTEPL